MPKHRSSATVTGIGIGIGFVALGPLTVALLLYNARRAGAVRWTVSDPREQGAAVAGYLASYLLPLLAIQPGGWRVTAASRRAVYDQRTNGCADPIVKPRLATIALD
ncbi:MAG: hypothetical protein ACLP0J_22035 [Solirubrobacteraceae bacterium]